MRLPTILTLLCAALAAARPTVREVRNLGEFNKLIDHHKANTGLPVVVDFYSDSCGPCRMIAPAFKKLGAEYKDRAVFAKVNVAVARDLSARKQIRSMPTFHFYLDGSKKSEFSGAGEYQLRQGVEAVVAESQKRNVKLDAESLEAFYAEHDPSKSRDAVAKIIKKCVSLSGASECVGGAARELAKKLEAKFGAPPVLGKRYDGASGGAPKAPKPPRRSVKAPLEKASLEELLAELAKRGENGDEAAFAAAEAGHRVIAELEAEEEDEDEEEEEGLPLYQPQPFA
eukprot:CAMPEP_0119263978 /NCGR_PEP_ID=MMETSP1329-20130426/3215_1 /TAXON_ID=114041 /ORGANISM="Genus nov. species nov., Strain RCC1024" /LENGTH=284 /DNA_ID=CAMNT_0007263719 /DNA_START=61 /DNA_END=912 /DNA_ORIENTATION=-